MSALTTPRSVAVITGLRQLAVQAQLTALATWMRNNADQAAALVERLLATRAAAATPSPSPDVDWNALPSLPAEGQTAAVRRRDNIAALQLLQTLGAKPATAAQRDTIAQYSGWGGVVNTTADVDKIPQALRPEDWRGLVDEYYTPSEVCRSVWRLLARLVDAGTLVANPICLEPAAGIGRFIRTAPKGLRWTAVEMSPQSAGLLHALMPELELHTESFQQYMGDHPPPAAGDVDLVVTNPPYAAQGAVVRFDPKGKYRGKHWPKAEQYFLHAAMRRTRPGGVIVQLVPLGVVRAGKSQKRLRGALLQGCHWLGAYALPGDLFPGAKLGLALVILRKRTAPVTTLSDADNVVFEGGYFESEDGQRNIGGRWASEVAAETGKSAYREMVIATTDALPIEEMLLRDPGASRPAAPSPPVPTKAIAAESKPPTLKGSDLSLEELATYQRAVGLDRRLQAWSRSKDDPHEEAIRRELAADVADWVDKHGSQAAYLKRLPAGTGKLKSFAASGASGQLASRLGKAAPAAVSAFQGDTSDVAAIVRMLSGRHGRATWDEVHSLSPKATLSKLPQSVMLEPTPGGDWLLYDAREYLSGDLYARLDKIDAALRAPGKRFHARLERQRNRLLDQIAPKPIEDINVDFRNGLVSNECMSEWLTEVNGGHEVKAEWLDGLLFVDGTRLTEQVQDIAAFASRREQYDRRGDTKKSRRHDSKASLQQKMRLDRQVLEEFNWWIRAHERWGPHLEDRYNRAYRSWHPRKGASDPLPLSRAADTITLRDHQVGAIRSLSEARAGIIGHDVGLGKTFLALGLVAWWRQHGMTRRPIIVVPKQVVTNWLREAKMLLPDYDIGVIGLSWSERKKGYREDRPDDKRAKWKAFANGDYDLLLVTQPAFEEISVSPETSKTIMERAVWLRREEKLHEHAASYQHRRITAKKLELDTGSHTAKQSEQLRKEILSAEDQLSKMKDRRTYLQDVIDRTQRELNVTGDDAQRAKLKKALERHTKSLAKEEKSPTLRQLEAAREKFEQWRALTEFERAAAAGGELGISWEDVGCDLLLLDEAHSYKNLFRPETRYGQSPKYLGNSGGDECKRCWDLWVKSSYLRDQHDGTGVVLLTATPLKNSPLELYSMLQYVRPEVFEQRGIRTHEEFIDRYCGFSDAAVLDTTGQLVDRLVVDRFEHLDEIRAILDLYVDLRDAEDVGLAVPAHVTEQVSVPMTSEQEEAYAVLRELGRDAIAGDADTNILAVLHKMSLAALDLRLLDPELYASFRPPKYEALAQNILSSGSCAHIVFISQSKLDSLDYCTQALVEAGVPRSKIVTMHGGVKQGERQRIVDALNDGTYDVIIGNQVMSEGLNLQARACSMHHVDLPWTPSDIQQRNGRAVRQGNKYASDSGQPVTLYYYLAEGSADGYRLQLIAGKRGWLHTLIKSSATSANNPLADAGTSEDDLIVMFAEDADAARAELAKKKVAAAAIRLQEAQLEVVKRFHQYASVLQRARREPDPTLTARFRRQAEQLERFLNTFSTDAFPEDKRPLMAEARAGDVAWLGGDTIIRPDTALRLQDEYGTYLVLDINLPSRRVTVRGLGRFPAQTFRFGALATAVLKEWDPTHDRDALERQADGYVNWDARALHRVPPALLDEYGERLWKRLAQNTWARGPESIPYLEDDRLVVRRWKEATTVPRRVPLMPSPDGWKAFMAAAGQLEPTAQEWVARRWFKRALPLPAQVPDVADAALPSPKAA